MAKLEVAVGNAELRGEEVGRFTRRGIVEVEVVDRRFARSALDRKHERARRGDRSASDALAIGSEHAEEHLHPLLVAQAEGLSGLADQCSLAGSGSHAQGNGVALGDARQIVADGHLNTAAPPIGSGEGERMVPIGGSAAGRARGEHRGSEHRGEEPTPEPPGVSSAAGGSGSGRRFWDRLQDQRSIPCDHRKPPQNFKLIRNWGSEVDRCRRGSPRRASEPRNAFRSDKAPHEHRRDSAAPGKIMHEKHVAVEVLLGQADEVRMVGEENHLGTSGKLRQDFQSGLRRWSSKLMSTSSTMKGTGSFPSR